VNRQHLHRIIVANLTKVARPTGTPPAGIPSDIPSSIALPAGICPLGGAAR